MPKGQTLAEVEQESAHDTIKAIMAEATVGGKTLTVDDAPTEKPKGSDIPSEQAAPKAATTPKEIDAEAKARQERRDERGRFKAAAGEEAAPAPKGAAEATVASAAPAAPVAPDQPEPIDPPTEWKAAEQETFRSLPRPAQEFLLAKYNASREVETRASQTAGKYTALEQMLAPRRAALARDGLDEVSYLQYLDRLSQSAAQDPKGFVRWFAQQRGIRPEEVFGQPQQPAPTNGQRPPAQGADPYINQLEQRLGQFESWMHNQARTAEEGQQRALVTEIASFGSAKDATTGKLAHPYFEEVRPLMGSLLKTEQASDLQVAYDMACRAHPEVSRKIAGAAQAAAERDRQAEQRKKAEAARNAGSSISGTPGDRSAPPPSGDVREELRRQFAAKGLIGA
jgi:hypothetical protein